MLLVLHNATEGARERAKEKEQRRGRRGTTTHKKRSAHCSIPSRFTSRLVSSLLASDRWCATEPGETNCQSFVNVLPARSTYATTDIVGVPRPRPPLRHIHSVLHSCLPLTGSLPPNIATLLHEWTGSSSLQPVRSSGSACTCAFESEPAHYFQITLEIFDGLGFYRTDKKNKFSFDPRIILLTFDWKGIVRIVPNWWQLGHEGDFFVRQVGSQREQITGF